MKCQAFVTFPTADLASSALLQVHGVVLREKPLIVVRKEPVCAYAYIGFLTVFPVSSASEKPTPTRNPSPAGVP
jgi:RNA recognition motif-containing protein